MKLIFTSIITGLILAASVYSSPVTADEIVVCKSKEQRHKVCPIKKRGYVTLRRQTSRADCIQGRTWDYDERSIWVDENCKGEFVVEKRKHSKSSNSEDALAAAAALAIIAAATSSGDDRNSKYNDDDYYGGRHSSYIPDWMVGRFLGYNIMNDALVSLDIKENGRVSASIEGLVLSGYVNDERLYIGDSTFYIDRESKGLRTTEVGNKFNQVRYRRQR